MPYELYLVHHGIKGQQWGIRNGPPYPLGSGRTYKKRSKSLLVKGTKKEQSSSEYDHSKSKKAAEISLFLAYLGIHALQINPVGLTFDAIQLGQVIHGIAAERKVEKRIAKNPNIDKKTGLHLKEEDSQWTDQKDVKQINPAFRTFDANRKNNCMLCSVAYDMRKRGYDVMAQPASYGYEMADIKRWYPKAKVEIAAEPTKTGMTKNLFADKEMVHNAISNIESQGDGARGHVYVQWRGAKGGHAMAYQVDNGKMTVLDGQTGTIYKKPEKILNRASSINVCRLDNINFDSKYIKECVR